MKILALALTLLSLNVFAKESKKDEKKIFKCIREAIDSHRFTRQDVLTIDQLLRNASQGINREQELLKCESFIADLAKQKERTVEVLDADIRSLANDKTLPYYSTEVISRMLIGKFMTCRPFVINADVVLGVGGGVTVLAGKCIVDNGHAYLVTGLGGALGLGVYAGVTMGIKEYRAPISGVDKGGDEIAGGIILAFRVDTGDNYDDGRTGIGLGLAWLPVQSTVHLPVIKRLNDFSLIKEKMLEGIEQESQPVK